MCLISVLALLALCYHLPIFFYALFPIQTVAVSCNVFMDNLYLSYFRLILKLIFFSLFVIFGVLLIVLLTVFTYLKCALRLL